jgi:hypothetical protein
MNTKFTFTNKEEYLAYRSAWKLEYKILSQTIRDRKWMTKHHQRAYSTVNREIPNYFSDWKSFDAKVLAILSKNDRYVALDKLYPKKVLLERLRLAAKQMNIDLKLAKVEANRQYQEQHASV